MTIDQWDSKAEWLRHANQGVIDRAITVRVELAHNLSGDTGRLYVTLVGAKTHLTHLIDDAALNRL